MDNDFTLEYSRRSDNELLRLANDRASLTTQAEAALVAELRRRNLNEADLARHQHFVRRYKQIDSKRRRRRIFGRWSDPSIWIHLLLAVLVILVISAAYNALPSKFHFKPDWQEAAEAVMWVSVFIALGPFNRRTVTFWVSLVVSSSVHLAVAHAMIQREGTPGRDQSELAIVLGLVLFFVLYFLFWVLRQKFFREEEPDTRYR